MKKLIIGIQLFSVREEIKEYGLDAVLSALKEAGCTAVEFAGFYSYSVDEIKAMLEETGLEMLSDHVPFAVIETVDLLGYSVDSER